MPPIAAQTRPMNPWPTSAKPARTDRPAPPPPALPPAQPRFTDWAMI
ncbi:MAG: hypothetical protein ACK4LQ_08835 [Pararhodobacter sp.]